MDYEYKCVGAPEKPRKSRRAKTGSQRLAVSMEEVIQEEAVNGWEYMRTDLIPVTEKPGLFSRAQEVHRAVLVFRRELAVRTQSRSSGRTRRPAPDFDDGYDAPAPERRPRRALRPRAHEEDEYEPRSEPSHRTAPEPEEPPRRRRAIPAEEPIRLSADDMIDEAHDRPARGRDRSPPSGLG